MRWDSATILRYVAITVITIWMAGSIYQEFIVVDPDQYSYMSGDVQEEMSNCSGDFQQRYDCKNAIIIKKGQQSFVIWMEKVAWIFIPPGLLWGLISLSSRNKKPNILDQPAPKRTTRPRR